MGSTLAAQLVLNLGAIKSDSGGADAKVKWKSHKTPANKDNVVLLADQLKTKTAALPVTGWQVMKAKERKKKGLG